MKCMDCAHYKPIKGKDGFGDCFGVEVPGNLDPRTSEKCGEKYFKAR